jgi:hypothetical protein
MAQITINIPVDKEDWVLDGWGAKFGYQTGVTNPSFDDRTDIPNPAYDDQIPEDPETNPSTIPNPDYDPNPTITNPEVLPAFVKRMIIETIKKEATHGHNLVGQQLIEDLYTNNNDISDGISIT